MNSLLKHRKPLIPTILITEHNRTRLLKFIFLILALIVFFVSNVNVKFWIGISIGTKVLLSYEKRHFVHSKKNGTSFCIQFVCVFKKLFFHQKLIIQRIFWGIYHIQFYWAPVILMIKIVFKNQHTLHNIM